MPEKPVDSNNPILSILLPTVTSRCDLFRTLKAEVDRQCIGQPVEVLVACDNKEISIGQKRQNLLQEARGEWVVFIDDDDGISKDYVESILGALKQDPDSVGFVIHCTFDGANDMLAKASRECEKWQEGLPGPYSIFRTPYQKTPVRRSIALQVGFPDLRYGEDRVYSDGILPLLKSEVFLDKILYYYKYRKENHRRKYGIPRTGKGIRNDIRRKRRLC